MPSKKILFVSFLSLAAVGIALRKLATRGQLPTHDLWHQRLTARHGFWYAETVMERAAERYAALLAGAKPYKNPILRRHYRGNILPAIALYQTLQAEGWNMREIHDTLSDLISAGMRPQTALLRLLAEVPDPFPVFRALLQKQMQWFYPAEGWQTDWQEDSPERVAFNISRCFYLDAFSAHGVPELTPIFCEQDDLLAEAFPPQIRWRRKGTLGKGDDVCDFCYERVRRE